MGDLGLLKILRLLALMLAASLSLKSPQLASAQDCIIERAEPTCNNGDPLDGYWWYDGWVPGYISLDSWFAGSPVHAIGNAVYYAPFMMEATAAARGLSLEGYVDGVSGLSCADVGLEVWIKRDPARTTAGQSGVGQGWEGPFLNVDCAQRNDMYGAVVFRGEVIEVGFETALKWGMVERTSPWSWRNLIWRLEEVAVSKLPPEHATGSPVPLLDWWLSGVTFVTPSEYGEELRNGWTRPRYDPSRSWGLRGTSVSFGQPTMTPIPLPTSTRSFTSTPVPINTPTPKPSMTPSPTSSATITLNMIPTTISTKEVVNRGSMTLSVLAITAALFAGLIVTVRDLRRLGGKR